MDNANETSTGDDLASKTIGGLVWSYASIAVIAILQIVYTGIMARLLTPSAFGLVAMANIILRFGTYFARMGIGPALVQKKDLSEDDIRAAFTSSLLISSAVTLIVVILAPLAALLFNDEEVVPVVRIMAFTLFVTGSSSTTIYLLRRNFQFRYLTIAEIISFALGIIVGVVLAVMGYGIWSLVICSLLQASGLWVLSFLFSRHSLQLSFDLKKYAAILSYGGKLSIATFLEFINYNLDTMAIGRWMGSAELGIYNRAYYIVALPAQQVSTSLTKVFFSSLSKIQSAVEKLRTAYISIVLVLGILLFAFGFGVSAASHEIISIVLGSHWEKAIPVLRIMSLAVPFNLLVSINGIFFDVTARLKTKILLAILRLILLVVLYFLFFRYGLMGFAWAFLITEVAFYAAYTSLTIKFLNISLRDILFVQLIIMSVGGFEFIIVSGTAKLLTAYGATIQTILFSQIIIAVFFLATFMIFTPPRLLAQIIRKGLNNLKLKIIPGYIMKSLVDRYQRFSEA